MLAIGSLVPLLFLNQAWTSSWFMYCWSLTWRILSITLLACEMSATVWQFEHSLALPLGLAWKLPFSSPVATAGFSKCAGTLRAALWQHLKREVRGHLEPQEGVARSAERSGARLTELGQENALVTANTLFQQYKRRLYTCTSPDGQHQNQTDYILCSRRKRSSIHSAKTIPGADGGSNHELLIAKFVLKLKKVGKITRPLRYDLNQIPYNYTVEETNRFKGLDLIDRVPEELWTETHDTVQEAVIK